MNRFVLLIIVCALAGFSIFANTPPQNQKVVTAAQANGVYRYYDNEFRILALGHNKLKVQRSALNADKDVRALSINHLSLDRLCLTMAALLLPSKTRVKG